MRFSCVDSNKIYNVGNLFTVVNYQEWYIDSGPKFARSEEQDPTAMDTTMSSRNLWFLLGIYESMSGMWHSILLKAITGKDSQPASCFHKSKKRWKMVFKLRFSLSILLFSMAVDDRQHVWKLGFRRDWNTKTLPQRANMSEIF